MASNSPEKRPKSYQYCNAINCSNRSARDVDSRTGEYVRFHRFPDPQKKRKLPKFNVSIPNEVHQDDLLFLPHDKCDRVTYKYALTSVDVASRFKAAESQATKEASGVANALTRIYKQGPLKWPKPMM
ncbi:hypothetical protein CAPTEDRAFT_186023 [Capitella teleta]|uniref:Uncharacterized protein n=1 Tax=Capitella teleta TaxID=283909 RepID=R7V457_CAPTE|nr:hypothetical protein CAPTEDRAFT_186023 [Capitella teleta]|eukprot:ELU13349.1 hypothetical protein CAPTEDRAFT_186023 [Capitella teleta]